ncbi:putative dual-specificity RNA methyltransferase RlmN 2 [Diplonema papillatum]|nr:putative dual-specificity RNA methyltransferase RlmN 2 [Diplonema papillatum]
MAGAGPARPPLSPGSIFDLPVLLEALGSVGKNADHARTIQKHALKSVGQPWSTICKAQELPKAVVSVLDEEFLRLTSKVVERRESVDGTVKMLVRLQDGLEVETVVIPMAPGYSTVCVSSQVGCAMGCTFCATGMMGLKGNLTAGEIVEQIVHARDTCPERNVRNVVFMGMGEPMQNYENVLTAVRTLTDQKTFSMPASSITISTVGVVSGIRSLARDAPWVRLAFSLHSPDQNARKQIVPSANRYPLDSILDALDYYSSKSTSKVMIEFTVLKGTNDSPAVAHDVGRLLQGRNVVINLIPYNPTSVKESFQVPSPETVEGMWQILVKEYNLKTTIRHQHGVDIGGACGQLALQQEGGKVLPDVEDTLAARAPSAVPASKRNTPAGASQACVDKIDYDSRLKACMALGGLVFAALYAGYQYYVTNLLVASPAH